MEIASNLTEFPLPELLQFLDHRQVTGWLSLSVSSNHYKELKPRCYDIWLSQGHIVSAQRDNCHQDVYSLSVQKDWIRPFVAKKLKNRAPDNMAAGLYLESQSVLNFEQLKTLFVSEVIYRVESLCHIHHGRFIFQTKSSLPMGQMTGMRIPANTVASYGLEQGKTYYFLDTEYYQEPIRVKGLSTAS